MEGLGMSIIEAMMHGVCPLVSNVGGIPEIVRDQTDGIVVPSEDVTALAAAIRLLHDDPKRRQTLAASARQRVFDRFSIDQWTKRLVDFYERAVGAPNRDVDLDSRVTEKDLATSREIRAA